MTRKQAVSEAIQVSQKNKKKRKSVYRYTEEQFINEFIQNYNHIYDGNYVKSKDYDRYKKSGTPALKTIMRNTHCSAYQDLLKKAGIKKVQKPLKIVSDRELILSDEIQTKVGEIIKKVKMI